MWRSFIWTGVVFPEEVLTGRYSTGFWLFPGRRNVVIKSYAPDHRKGGLKVIGRRTERQDSGEPELLVEFRKQTTYKMKVGLDPLARDAPILDTVSPAECVNYFANAGYDQT